MARFASTPLGPMPDWLQAELANHRDRYAPVWRGFLSDHLPMTAMALWQRGVSRTSILTWMKKYQTGLDAIGESPVIEDWRGAMGDAAAYAGLVRFFDAEIARLGEVQTLQTFLPHLISAWVADAFHPMIRLGYGLRFGCKSEVAAGLSYLAIKGPNARLEALAAAASPGEIVWPRAVKLESRVFDEKVVEYLGGYRPTVSLPDNSIDAYVTAALDILNATHNFFALHLVTGLHAYRIATAGVAGIPDGMFAAGLVAGYVAAGAPAFKSSVSPKPFHTDFEHDIKLAFAVADTASLTGDARYREAGDVYFNNCGDVEAAIRRYVDQ